MKSEALEEEAQMSTDNPIDALLEAERNAEEAIQRAKDDARQTINQALEQARTVRARAEKRITDLHARSAAKVETQCQALWQAHEANISCPLDRYIQDATIEDITHRLARGLTTNGHNENDGGGDG